MVTQKCTICGQEKPEQNFILYAGKRHGECRDCEKTLRRCVCCKELKPAGQFMIRRGQPGSWCKVCKAGYSQEYDKTSARKDAAKAYRATASRQRYVKDYMKGYRVAYLASQGNRWKYKARIAANKALRDGKLIRPASCQCNGKYGAVCAGRLEMHHHLGYEPEHWLDIEWLSAACHVVADALQRKRMPLEIPAGTLAVGQWEEVLTEQDWRCFYCQRSFGSDLTPTIDHLNPASKGGAVTRENTVASCGYCNISKGRFEWPLTRPDGTIIMNELIGRMAAGYVKAGQNTSDPLRKQLIAVAKQFLAKRIEGRGGN